MFEGPAAPDFSNQVHDFDPGFGDCGLFWMVPIPSGAAHIEPGAGKASFRMENLAITDYGSIPNGLFHFAPPTPGRVSFDIEWSGVTARNNVRNPDPMQRFGGEFATTQAHVMWRGWIGDALVFESSDDGQTTAFGQVGDEFNGAFFPG